MGCGRELLQHAAELVRDQRLPLADEELDRLMGSWATAAEPRTDVVGSVSRTITIVRSDLTPND